MSRSLLIASAVAAFATTAAAPSRAETMDELYAKAKPEGSLTLYAAGPTEPHERSAKAFEQRFPGLKVSITGGFSNVLNAKINQQLKDNKPNFVQGNLPVARSVATGENAATLDASSSSWRFKREGQPIEVIFSAEDETPVFTVTAGIFKDAPHP